MTWINLVAMVAFLFNGLMSVVTAALADLNIYPKVTAEVGGDDYEGSWIEHSEVLEQFKPSRPIKHWHHGYGFALAVDTERDRPYLLCFKSGLTEWYVLWPPPAPLKLVSTRVRSLPGLYPPS
jgi:hypothetical protein